MVSITSQDFCDIEYRIDNFKHYVTNFMIARKSLRIMVKTLVDVLERSVAILNLSFRSKASMS